MTSMTRCRPLSKPTVIGEMRERFLQNSAKRREVVEAAGAASSAFDLVQSQNKKKKRTRPELFKSAIWYLYGITSGEGSRVNTKNKLGTWPKILLTSTEVPTSLIGSAAASLPPHRQRLWRSSACPEQGKEKGVR